LDLIDEKRNANMEEIKRGTCWKQFMASCISVENHWELSLYAIYKSMIRVLSNCYLNLYKSTSEQVSQQIQTYK
jgi:hypothetical protein